MNFDVANVLERKPEIRRSSPGAYVRQRVAAAAADLSRAGRMAARVELVNEALCHLVELLYLVDSDGARANVDAVTFRLLIPAPWGSAGWRKWGLRKREGAAFNRIMRRRVDGWTPAQRPPLFKYDYHQWFLNAFDYPTVEAAGWWLQKQPITLKEWRAAVTR